MHQPESCGWRQINVAFPDWPAAEHTALTHLIPLLAAAETEGRLRSWWFLRKAPCWRVRYLATQDPHVGDATLEGGLSQLTQAGIIDGWTPIIYEPEVHAFGGPDGMAHAHRFFHRDSHGVATFLTEQTEASDRRREISILLCTTLLRSAGLDWYEQGDVWARVAEHRPLDDNDGGLRAVANSLRPLMSTDASALTRPSAPLSLDSSWAGAYGELGRELAQLAAAGALTRGLRAVLAHHVIFAWNRLGLPRAVQAVLAHAATAVVFGHHDEHQHPKTPGTKEESWTAPTEP